jgi:hypothetical protein
MTPAAPASSVSFDVVIPTVGRDSLQRLLAALDAGFADAPVLPGRVILVHDRPGPAPLDLGADASRGRYSDRLSSRLAVLPGPAAGPAAARNVGWRTTSAGTEWVAFLDDDVLPPPTWAADLVADLARLGPDVGADVGASQGRLRVRLPSNRRPTDWERNVAGLANAAWATADMAYRRAALEAVGGFDERFPRAYREDADLALRVQAAGWRLTKGDRVVDHPVRPADRWVSVRLQAGNADDVLMRALHGCDWRQRCGAPPGRRGRHLAVTAAGVAAVGAAAARRPALAIAAAVAWLAGTAELAWARIAPGPRTREEVVTMLATSAVLPAAATAWWLRGIFRWRRLLVRAPFVTG